MITGVRTIFGIDLRTLGLFRIVLGLVIIADLINRAQYLTFFYTDHGVMTTEEARAWLGSIRLSFHLLSGATWFQVLLFVIAGVIAALFTIGYRTGLMTVLSWVFLLSLQNRNLIVQQAGDILLLLLLFWSIFLPLGARFSVDAARAPPRETPQSNAYFSAATVAILLQAIYVYVIGALLKGSPDWITEGTAVYYALHLETYATSLGHWLRQFGSVMKALTHYVWVLELVAPLIVFSPVFHLPLRLIGQVLLITMHIGFALFLFIGLFPAVSISSLLLFTPGAVWDWHEKRTGTIKRLGAALAGMGARLAAVFPARARPEKIRLHPVETGFVVVMTVLVFLWNLQHLAFVPYSTPRWADTLFYALKIDQRWDMFAPRPARTDGWYVIHGRLDDGSPVDLWTGTPGKPDFKKPESVYDTYGDYRVRKYFSRIWLDRYRSQLGNYARHLCRKWNEDGYGRGRELVDFELWFVKETSLPDYLPRHRERLRLKTWICSAEGA